MNWKALLFLGCLAPLTGCLLARDTARNFYNEPAELHDNKVLKRQLHREARSVWEEVCQQFPKRTFTTDFHDGFVAGYVDFLDSGGSAQPPAMPPLKYRRTRYMSAEGHALIQDYFCGFKYGCEVAAASGKRNLITVPLLLPEPPAESPVQARQLPPISTVAPTKPTDDRSAPPKPKAVDIGTGLPLLDRPLATIPEVPSATAPMSVDTPPVMIPVIEGPPKFTPPMFEFPNGPRSDAPTTEPIVPTDYSPATPANSTAPLREFPAARVKPYRLAPETQPRAPWRGD